MMVNYFLIVPPGDGATTPFQGYNVEVVEEDFLYLLEVLGGVKWTPKFGQVPKL